MQKKNTLEKIEKEILNLNSCEQLKLIELLIHKLREKIILKDNTLNLEQFYGIGKGIWHQDAQNYIDHLREDR